MISDSKQPFTKSGVRSAQVFRREPAEEAREGLRKRIAFSLSVPDPHCGR